MWRLRLTAPGFSLEVIGLAALGVAEGPVPGLSGVGSH